MNKGNVEKPLQEVRRWKRAVSKKIARMTAQDEIKCFGKVEIESQKHLATFKRK